MKVNLSIKKFEVMKDGYTTDEFPVTIEFEHTALDNSDEQLEHIVTALVEIHGKEKVKQTIKGY